MSDFAEYCCELLSSVGNCHARRMFGAHGISCDGLNFALIIDERLYLKVDEQTREAFAAAGGEPFIYRREGHKPVEMSYWTVPSEAMDSTRLMAPWARMAMDAALRNPSKPKSARRPGVNKVAASKGAVSTKPAPKVAAGRRPASKTPRKS